MGQTREKNFLKRFGGRFSMSFAERPLTPTERKVQNEALCKAVTGVMTGILKREPTQEELLGLEDISIHKRRRRK